MERVAFFVTPDNWGRVLRTIGGEDLIATVERESSLEYEPIEPGGENEVVVRGVRSHTSAKSVLFPAREVVAVYPDGGEVPAEQNRVLVGLRACDLESLRLLDKVFLEGDFVEPFYSARRESALLITVDCREVGEKCFCNLVGGQPFAKEGFDINISPIDEGYVVEAGNERGKEALLRASELMKPAGVDHLSEVEFIRQQSLNKLTEQNAQYAPSRSYTEILKSAQDSDKWKEEGGMCVECGSCSLVCPTCHCFMLYDQPSRKVEGRFERIRSWDSCLYTSFGRMAGVRGVKPNPRAELWSRLQNRFMHKFVWFVDDYGVLGCVGCGRCSESCLGGADIREELKELEG